MLSLISRYGSINRFFGCPAVRDRIEFRREAGSSGPTPVDHRFGFGQSEGQVVHARNYSIGIDPDN
jgi:hypothetical protein